MKKLTSVLGYTAAVLAIAVAVLTPFLLMDLFTHGVAATGVRIDPVYAGGEPERTIAMSGYQVVVHRPVHSKALLGDTASFVQLSWKPAAALPARVSDEIDLDQDGKPDLVAVFDVPRNPKAELRVDLKPLTALVRPMSNVGVASMSSLISRAGDSIVVRIPLRPPR
jgi:hypothetical protein